MTADGRLAGGRVGLRSQAEWHHEGPGLASATRIWPGHPVGEPWTEPPGRRRRDASGVSTPDVRPRPVQDRATPLRRLTGNVAADVGAGDKQIAGLGILASLSEPVLDMPEVSASTSSHSVGRIIALIPAHNEAAGIATALYFLRVQIRRPDRVIVIANNCTDNTAEIAAACGAEVMIMEGNRHKKAGALNYGLAYLLPRLRDEDAILLQDADSFMDPCFIAATARKLGEGFAAAGGNFRGRPGGGLCGILQRNEYARYARDTARKHGRVLCITGVGTLFGVRALRDVAAGIRDGRLPDAGGGYVYSYATLTEDNWMTLALKHLGYQVVSPKDATMSTEPRSTGQFG